VRTGASLSDPNCLSDPTSSYGQILPIFLSLSLIGFLKHDMEGMKKEAAGLVNDPTWGDGVLG
jgi:hypothetical protein